MLIAALCVQHMIESAYNDVMRCMDSVKEKVYSKFLERAETLAQKYPGGKALLLSLGICV